MTDEHPFHVADTAEWTRADGLVIGDHLSTISGTALLEGVVYTTERVPVYNLSIPGSPTYYVGEHGVWVHNSGPCKPSFRKLKVDWDHIFSRHTANGDVFKMSGIKSAFPKSWSERTIKHAVKDAYKNGERVQTQVLPSGQQMIRLRGRAFGKEIEIWYNQTLKTLNTAYPTGF
tara:strand:- start:833575 stop:834096 length:522 start_codon:yes stop_codon:yes gene_type:complete